MSRYISVEVERSVRLAAGHRCGYCCAPQYLLNLQLEIEHLLPVARGGTDDEENLWLSCRPCNGVKGAQIQGFDATTNSLAHIFNPRRQTWLRHFKWSDEGTHIIGQTACGRATVEALDLNNEIAVTVRRMWVSAGWHPPQDTI